MKDDKAIKMTAKYFNISQEKATKMVEEQKKRNAATEERAALMLEVINSGQKLKGGIWV